VKNGKPGTSMIRGKRGQPESVSEIDFKRVLYSMEKALKMAE